MTDTVIVKGRLRQKHDIEANWKKATTFAPLSGEIIVYDPDYDEATGIGYKYARFKIGIWDGIAEHKTEAMLVSNLPFLNSPDCIPDVIIKGLFS